jgi:hypothetical protein
MARPERGSREWSTCIPCRNLNRIKKFGANNFDIKGCVHFIQLLHHADNGSIKAQKHSHLQQVWKRNYTDLYKCRKLFNYVSTKTSACKNLILNLDSCLSNNVCRNCVDKTDSTVLSRNNLTKTAVNLGQT